MRKLGIKTLVSTAVKNVQIIDEHCVIEIENSKGTGTIETDIVLSAVGIAANIEGIGLEELGIITERNKIIVNDFFQTNIPNIYAIGDIIPTIALAHVATKEGEIAVSHILGMPTEKIDYSTIPACIFTSPEVASVGLRERQCTEKGINIKIGRFSYMASGKAASSGMKDGLVKLIFKEDDHKLIGAHLMGADVVEMIGECTLAISNGLTAEDIADIIHAHPTMHEAIMEAASVAFE